MAVTNTTNKISFISSGSSMEVLWFSMKGSTVNNINIYLNSTLLTAADYTLTVYADGAGGQLLIGASANTSGLQPEIGDSIVIERIVELTQLTDYVENDAFPAESHENALDKLTHITQQLQDASERSIRYATTVTNPGNVELQTSAEDRANKLFAFDSEGNLDATQELGSWRGDWGGSTIYLERDLVKDATTKNVHICTESHTSYGVAPLSSNPDFEKWAVVIDSLDQAKTLTVEIFNVGVGGQQSFSLPDWINDGSEIVSLNGVLLTKGVGLDYTTGTDSIYLLTAAVNGDELTVRLFHPFATADFIPNTALTDGTIHDAIDTYPQANLYTQTETDTLLDDKQDSLIGEFTPNVTQNLKTVNGHNLLGEGDVDTESGRVYATKLVNNGETATGKHNYAVVMSNGTAQIWGDGLQSVLGVDGDIDQIRPSEILFSSGTNIVVDEIYLNSRACFIQSTTGGLWGFGDNNGTYGSIGVGSTSDEQTIPKQITFPENDVVVTKVLISSAEWVDHSSVWALDDQGRVWSWGFNDYGQLCDGTTTARTSPVRVIDTSGVDTTGVIDIACADVGKYASFYVIDSDNKVFASGINNRGQLGNGTTTATGANNPGYVLDNAGAHLALTNITKVKAYASSHNDTNVYHGVYFINDVGISYACGYNGSAFVGDNSTTDMPYAKEMTELSALTPTVLNLWSSSPVHGAHVALLSDNTVRVWGRYNNDGALGQGDTLGELEPVQPIDIDDNFIADVIDVRLSGTPASTDANTETTMYLLLSSGKVLGSGYNGVGQLGIGYISESEEKFTPMLGTSLNGVNDIASIGTCGFDHEGAFFVLKTNGTLWVTGKNTEGQMGTDEAVDTIRRKLVRVRLET